MTGRPGHPTMEMNGGSTMSNLAGTPCVPVFLLILLGLEAKGLLDFQGRHGITSVVWQNLRPVIFGVELLLIPPFFFCASFFPLFAVSTPPFPRQCSSPKSPSSGTSDLVFLVEKKSTCRAGFWGRFWTGSPHRKKENPLFYFFWRAKKR